MDNLQDKCDRMVGISIDIRGVDYGRIMRWELVESNGKTYHVFITSLGKKVEATSYFDYKRKHIHYPDGSDYAFRLRYAGAKAKSKHQSNGGAMFGDSIRNIARFSKGS